MSERTLKQLVGALVVAVVLWGAATLLAGGGGAIGGSGGISDFFSAFDAEAVDEVRVAGPQGSVVLMRSADGWRANGYDADQDAVERMLRALEGAEVGDLAATNPANHARMGLAADSAVQLSVTTGDESRTILVGDGGPRFGTAYGRLPDEDEVYLVDGDLRLHVRKPIDDWRDKEIVAVDTTAVARVEVERDGDAYILVRGDSVWTFEDGSEANATEVRSIMAELSAVIAAGFLSEGDSLLALPRGGANRALDGDGNVLADVTLGSGEGERWARAAGDSVVYRLSTFRVGRLAPPLDAVRPGS